MIFITGPLCSGKRTLAAKLLGCPYDQVAGLVPVDVQEQAPFAPDLTVLADQLAQAPIVIATEIGGGIVPIDPKERADREAAGQLACLLAERAETVIRMFCGIPTVWKGRL